MPGFPNLQFSENHVDQKQINRFHLVGICEALLIKADIRTISAFLLQC